MYKFSETLAWVAGVILPVGETLRRWLVASFGVGCGMGYGSWAFAMAQLQHVDPSGASGTTAAIVKFAMLGLSILGLAGALRERADRRNDPA